MKIRKHDICDIRNDSSENVFYDNPSYPSNLRTNFIPKGIDDKAVSHWHVDLEFVYVFQGKIKYKVNNDIIDINEGEGIFINSRQMHFIIFEPEYESNLYCAILHPSLLCSSEYIKNNYVIPFINNKQIPYIKLYSSISWNREILNSIEYICKHVNDDMAELTISNHFNFIFELIIRNNHIHKNFSSMEIERYNSIMDMIFYINEHFKEKILLEDLCSCGGVSKTTCCSIFKKYTNSSPIQYLLDFRLDKGANLLTHTNNTITEISYETGFNGASYFTELFKKRYGISPMKFRKNNRNT